MHVVDLVAAISFPILERIPVFGDFAVSPHGLGIAIGFGLGAVMMGRRAQKRGLGLVHDPAISESVQELLVRAAIGAIIGARFFYVLTHLDQFADEPIRVLYAWEGGLTFLGGVTGAILLAIPYARGRGWRMSWLLDSAAPGIALGLAIGRIGDLMIGDHIGAPTDFPLAWRCTANYWVRATNSFGRVEPLPYPVGGAEPTAGCFDVAVHHTALYDFGATIVVLAVLLLMERRRFFDGAFIGAWVFVYGALRITSDFARNDRTWFGLTGSQWSLVGAMALVLAVLLVTKPWKRQRWAWDRVFDHPWHQEDFDAEMFEVGEGPLLVGSGSRTRGAHAVLSAAEVERAAASTVATDLGAAPELEPLGAAAPDDEPSDDEPSGAESSVDQPSVDEASVGSPDVAAAEPPRMQVPETLFGQRPSVAAPVEPEPVEPEPVVEGEPEAEPVVESEVEPEPVVEVEVEADVEPAAEVEAEPTTVERVVTPRPWTPPSLDDAVQDAPSVDAPAGDAPAGDAPAGDEPGGAAESSDEPPPSDPPPSDPPPAPMPPAAPAAPTDGLEGRPRPTQSGEGPRMARRRHHGSGA